LKVEMPANSKLPWVPGSLPLMLAPMQGLTNRALRSLFIDRVRPDVVFTEFVRVKSSVRKNITENDRQEVVSTAGGVPLVVQLIGTDTGALLAAANTVQELGAEHLNINLGCPYGRMTSRTAGGALLREPVALARMLAELRREIGGSFSVKVRSGFDDPAQIFSLLGLFADSGIDFLVVHPRTVKQMYGGAADHGVTAGVVRQTMLPVIANGDIFSAAAGRRVLAETRAAGLMLGRGAIADPLLFERLRGRCPDESAPAAKAAELREYLRELLERYRVLFSGEQQILCKMKEVLCHVHDPDVADLARRLKRSKNLALFEELLAS
jgi:tRNA-dihydrouridine synthase B